MVQAQPGLAGTVRAGSAASVGHQERGMKFSRKLEEYRIGDGDYASPPRATFGAFERLPGPCGAQLLIIATDGKSNDPELDGWEHVSVSILTSRLRMGNNMAPKRKHIDLTTKLAAALLQLGDVPYEEGKQLTA